MKILGIDIGGTFIKGAICDKDTILYETKLPTSASEGREIVLKQLFSLIRLLIGMSDDDSPIGIASAGDINPFTGEVVYATNTLPGFTGLPLGDIVKKETNRDVTVLNDADAALIGEMEYGAACGKPNAVLFTIGTGLGGGIAVDGHLLLGTNFHAARPGHIPLYQHGRKCTCGDYGCAEQYVSVTGLIQTAEEFGFEVHDGNCEELLIAAHNKDARAACAIDRFAHDFSSVIMTTQNLLDSDIIVIGGGLIQLKKYWWDKLIEVLPQSVRAKVVAAKLKNSAGCLGSAAAAINKSYFERK